MKPIISPSLLAADFGNLQRDVEMLNRSSADWFHLDVMDGVFVPNISFGFPVMQAIAAYAQKPLDVHLMIEKPEKFIDQVRNLGARYMNVHVEACPHLHRVVQQIHDAGMLAGATLNPSTPVEMLEDVLCDLDLALVMSVNPGFGGQKFIEHSLVKVEKLRRMADLCGSSAIIEVDGGVNLDNAPMLLEAGADALVAGSAIFNAPDPEAEIDAFKALE
jgi:ribulose-phosphate 3-epimerase